MSTNSQYNITKNKMISVLCKHIYIKFKVKPDEGFDSVFSWRLAVAPAAQLDVPTLFLLDLAEKILLLIWSPSQNCF